MNKIFGYTGIGWLNIILLQWFFLRLFYVENNQNHIEKYGIMFPIVPLTGWWGDYIPSKYWTFQL